MKYAFIVNPASGKGSKDSIVQKIKDIMEASSKDVSIYYTRGEKDATVLADMIATEAGDEQVVIFACGGDGTINEVANGIIGHENAVLGVVPVGSGNDYVRELGGGMNGGYNRMTVTQDGDFAVIATSEAEWHGDEPKEKKYTVSAEILNELEAVVRKYKMNNWHGKKFTDIFVCDGESESFAKRSPFVIAASSMTLFTLSSTSAANCGASTRFATRIMPSSW